MRAAIALATIAAFGAAGMWWGTDGGTAFTAEAVRRLDIAAAPRALPDVELTDQSGALLRLSDYRGRPVVLEFVYASCPDICLTLGTSFEHLDAALPPQVALVSISFDPTDDTERLGWFADRHGAEPPRWRVAGVTDDAGRAALLKAAGVVVLADGRGGFVHNAGLYPVDATGHLTAVYGPDDVEGVLNAFAARE